MGLLQELKDLFENIFMRSSPEVQKKQMLRKMNAEICQFQPLICRDGKLLPNFGEAIYTLYKNTRSLDNLFLQTVSSLDMPRQHRFEAQLIMTAYPLEDQEILEKLSFEKRKDEVLAEYKSSDRVYLRQKKLLEKVIKDLNTESFRTMDKDILNLRQVVDFCHYNYVPFMQVFDSNFEAGNFIYQPTYSEIPIAKALNLLEDLYYQISNMKITRVTLEMVLAIAKLRHNGDISSQEAENYTGALKKINFIINKVLSADKLKCIIRMAKEDPGYEPAVASYTGSPRQEFANLFSSRYEADEQRIKVELQDQQISTELQYLFPDVQLEEVGSYNQKYSMMLQGDTPLSFKWILPMRILKTFISYYISPGVKSLLNDLVIEGFFNNPNYKTTFSSIVYGVINSMEGIEDFEKSMESAQRNSVAVMESYVLDSKKDKDFYKKLEKMVNQLNNEAHQLLQTEVTNLEALYRELGELLQDAKKPSSEIIQNLKVLMMSSRNRDNTNLLEAQYPNWKFFFEIMKNYVIINLGDVSL